MAWYTTDHARRDAERQATRRQQAGLLDKPQTSKQVTGQDADAPQWTAADEAMRWLNEVELAQGGANGPTIKLRAALLSLAEDRMSGDEACRFAVWWAHKRKTFTTTRQAAWAAWTEARNKTPNVKLCGPGRKEQR